MNIEVRDHDEESTEVKADDLVDDRDVAALDDIHARNVCLGLYRNKQQVPR